MKCPVCKDVTLLMSEKKGIEIDYCPECRGIWLDRGELEKLIEKEVNYNNVHYEREENSKDGREYDRNYDRKYDENYYKDYDKDRKYKKDEYYDNRKHPRKRKKESFLEDIFDIFGD